MLDLILSPQFKGVLNQSFLLSIFSPLNLCLHNSYPCFSALNDQALAASLKKDIPAMVSGLLSTGIEFSVDMEELNKQEGILS